MKQAGLNEHKLEADSIRPSTIQHSVALTMADMCGANNVQLLAQDPSYTEEAKEMLKARGFSIVGPFGAGGFAEIDNDSVVFSAFVEAPLKQIVADLARPALIITTDFAVSNDAG
jgi:roadblock/LC7 domain-containing protein